MRYRNFLALLLLLVWLYASILPRLFLQWVGPHRDPNFEHGIFVPFFALFVLWQDRKKLRAIASAPSWAGLPLVVLSMLVLVLGVLGAGIFSSRVSLLILLAGLIILFQGWKFFSRSCSPGGGPEKRLCKLRPSSPALFQLEHHSRSNDQSFQRYPRYEIWLIEFLAPVIIQSHQVLRENGLLARFP